MIKFDFLSLKLLKCFSFYLFIGIKMSIQLKSRKKSEVVRRRLARFFFDEEIVLKNFLGGINNKNREFLNKIPTTYCK